MSGTEKIEDRSESPQQLRVQAIHHQDGRRSYLVREGVAGAIHARADTFLAPFAEGTQRTYAHHLVVDHLRWLAASGYTEETIGVADLRRYMALCGAEQSGPLGVPWRQRPLGEAALAVRASCLKGYYLDLTAREDINRSLQVDLSERRIANGRDRDRTTLGHLMASVSSNPLARAAPPRRHPRLLPDGAREALLDSVRTARDRMIVTWLSDSGMRIGELCGLSFCDLHLRTNHPCGERTGPHLHIVKRHNPNHASAKTARPARLVDGVITGGTVRRASPAMVDTYNEYLADEYHEMRAVTQTDLVLVHVGGPTAGQPFSTHGARQMLERAGRRAGLGWIKPHAFRHTRTDTRELGHLDTTYWGFRFPYRRSAFDLTAIPQRWLRDLTWDYLASQLDSTRHPRTQGPFEQVRRTIICFGTYLSNHDPHRGAMTGALSESTAKEFAADLKRRVTNARPLPGVFNVDGTPLNRDFNHIPEDHEHPPQGDALGNGLWHCNQYRPCSRVRRRHPLRRCAVASAAATVHGRGVEVA